MEYRSKREVIISYQFFLFLAGFLRIVHLISDINAGFDLCLVTDKNEMVELDQQLNVLQLILCQVYVHSGIYQMGIIDILGKQNIVG